MKIAIAQINPIIGNFKHNVEKIVSMVQKARQRSCDLVVFSEMVISGYPPLDLLENRQFIEDGWHALLSLLSAVDGIGAVVGVATRNPNDLGKPLHNSAFLIENGRILHQTSKTLLPTYDVFDESRYFEPASAVQCTDYKGKRIGLTICEDAWNDKDVFKNRLYRIDPLEKLTAEGADLIVNISASVYDMHKPAFRKRLLQSLAQKYRTPFIYANQVGGNDSLIFDGSSMGFDAAGGLCAQALDFEEDMVVVDTERPSVDDSQIHPVSPSTIASVLKALIAGTRDYVRKCGFDRVVIGLSGGIDSAVVLAIAAMALGKERVKSVFMPSRFTSKDNYEDTRLLADHFGVHYEIIPIDAIYEAFVRALPGETHIDAPGITEQNIQARVRGSILMAIANAENCLVLSTGNKSELAVGYCTLYGDMNGGLAVISDVPKTMVYEIARWINREETLIPQRILTKAPSAELRPDQTDQDDLPPYEILDGILRAYVEEGKSAEEIAALGFDTDTVTDVLGRIDRNEYKRYQAAPGLKVTSKAFGFGRRFPLAKRWAPA
ncbi:NAD+ synthase [Desulfatirhabdium butyrativorans]|uniref:NAD+ synthase n=1 Tax=Desulfatirhabdium butyrativorans TaxID=340467 RepID=UPI00041DF582|nr:NAD+ synthase [Desulfatirhabdium butyrativorans]